MASRLECSQLPEVRAMTSLLLCYPHPAGLGLHRPPYGDLHPTAGLPGNWALDFMAPGGTPFLSPQDATVTRFSGHDPNSGVIDGDIFGWNVYLTTSPGRVVYFATHLGDRTCKVGQKVRRGELLGHVGHWPNDPGRSHTHLGVTHPMGKKASVWRIENVAKAPMLPFPQPVTRWPAVFDGVGALFVRCDNDPQVELGKISPSPSWVAVKVNGPDASPPSVRAAWLSRVPQVHGGWVYCYGPPEDDVQTAWGSSFVIYDVESPYKTDEGAPADFPARLVAAHHRILGAQPAAVTSYGGYKSSIDFGVFRQAGWPIFAQGYDSFTCADALTYLAVYPPEGIHCLTRSLRLDPGQAVYRPESIDANDL